MIHQPRAGQGDTEPVVAPVTLPLKREAPTAPAAPPPIPEPPAPARRGRRRWPFLVAALLPVAGAGAYFAWPRTQAVPAAEPATSAEAMAPGEFHLSDAEMRALRIEPVALHDFR
ncbi:MAG TPA: hypothetical protein VE684_08660, partial [Crenalkalicoccus sp.]|nr:hypothetical protein [Crenalkalicoccus sp.]